MRISAGDDCEFLLGSTNMLSSFGIHLFPNLMRRPAAIDQEGELWGKFVAPVLKRQTICSRGRQRELQGIEPGQLVE